MSVGELTPDRLRELRRIAEAADFLKRLGASDETIQKFYDEFNPPTALALLDEIERLRRERETLADLLRQVDVVMDGAAMDGVKSILAPQYQDDWALVHTRVREQIALLDGEKGGAIL